MPEVDHDQIKKMYERKRHPSRPKKPADLGNNSALDQLNGREGRANLSDTNMGKEANGKAVPRPN